MSSATLYRQFEHNIDDNEDFDTRLDTDAENEAKEFFDLSPAWRKYAGSRIEEAYETFYEI